eukprot:m.217543 g.217543  ORF g.217543 m.217543 type:complete len:416 (+) comp33236_c0_seq22:228-1475(+)
MLALSGDNECMAQPCDVTGTYKSGSAYDCNSRGYTTFPTTTWGNDTTRIWLNSNHITLIPDNAFGELYSLVQLHLDRNKIKAIPRHTFDSLSALLFLSLAVNEITALPDQVFDGVREIQTLDLSNNQITAFPTNVFDGLTQVRKLTLTVNVISCSVTFVRTLLHVTCSSCTKTSTPIPLHKVECSNISFFQCGEHCAYGSQAPTTSPSTSAPTVSTTQSPTPSPTTLPSNFPTTLPTTPIPTASPTAPTNVTTLTPSRSPAVKPSPSSSPSPPSFSVSPTFATIATTSPSPSSRPPSVCSSTGFVQHPDVYTVNACEKLKREGRCSARDVLANCNTTCCSVPPVPTSTTTAMPVWGVVLLAITCVLVVIGCTYVVITKLVRQQKHKYTSVAHAANPVYDDFPEMSMIMINQDLYE